MIKSPISVIGGKYYLSNWLAEKIPEHVIYAEPFAGGGHLLFKKPESHVEILNDINDDLICFYKAIQNTEKRKQVENVLNSMPFARRVFNDVSKRWKVNGKPTDDVLRASEWYYLSRTCFSGDFHRGGFAAPNTNRNTARTFRNLTDSLEAVGKRLRCVTFENLNYKECIKKYDSKDTLFYCDSPYFEKEFYYKDGCFQESDHYELASLLGSVKGKVMATHYENKLYNDLYCGWNKACYETFKVSCGITKINRVDKRPKATEVLYCNF